MRALQDTAAGVEWRIHLREERARQDRLDALAEITHIAAVLNPILGRALNAAVDVIERSFITTDR
jgi:uncharacterized protein (DUF1778 family)